MYTSPLRWKTKKEREIWMLKIITSKIIIIYIVPERWRRNYNKTIQQRRLSQSNNKILKSRKKGTFWAPCKPSKKRSDWGIVAFHHVSQKWVTPQDLSEIVKAICHNQRVEVNSLKSGWARIWTYRLFPIVARINRRLLIL